MAADEELDLDPIDPVEETAPKAKAKVAKPEDFVDLTFIKELDQTGYIDNLYKR